MIEWRRLPKRSPREDSTGTVVDTMKLLSSVKDLASSEDAASSDAHRQVEPYCTVLRSENIASDRSSGSHAITMESIHNSLAGQVNCSSTAKVNFQCSSCTQSIATRK